MKPPSLSGWLLRDLAIVAILTGVLVALGAWHTASAAWYTAAPTAVWGFITAYVTCYLLHEWGHWAGGALSGATMGIGPYNQPLLAQFDISAHTARQFQWLSIGGIAGYLTVAGVCLLLYASNPSSLAGKAVAVGGLAFVVQSLSVDGPQVWRVARGADPLTTNRTGASAEIILRRTWQSWLALTAALIAFAVLG